jgi:hypothetical protein
MNKQVSRVWNFASNSDANIEFNHTTQHWEVKDLSGHVRFFAKSRSVCLEWEQRSLQPE